MDNARPAYIKGAFFLRQPGAAQKRDVPSVVPVAAKGNFGMLKGER